MIYMFPVLIMYTVLCKISLCTVVLCRTTITTKHWGKLSFLLRFHIRNVLFYTSSHLYLANETTHANK